MKIYQHLHKVCSFFAPNENEACQISVEYVKKIEYLYF